MRFKISSTEHGFEESVLIAKYPCLKQFGLEVENEISYVNVIVVDDNDNPSVQKKSITRRIPYIHIYSLEELKELMNVVGHELIIGDNYIEIFDGEFREMLV